MTPSAQVFVREIPEISNIIAWFWQGTNTLGEG